jgi:cell division protein FtsA
MDGSPLHTAVLPIGGNNVTNDIAIGLKTSLIAAEDLKIKHGTALPNDVAEDDQVDVQGIGEGDASSASKRELAEIIEARMREVFEKIDEEIEKAGYKGMLPAGLVLTGGASQLAGSARLGREVLQMPVRVAGPSGVQGLTDHLLTPEYSTSLGLLTWGAQAVHSFEPLHYESAAAPSVVNRMREWARGLLP